MSCDVGCKRGSDPLLLWLWRRPASTTTIRPLAWEPPRATGSGPRKGKKTKKNKERHVLLQVIAEVPKEEPCKDNTFKVPTCAPSTSLPLTKAD